MLKIQSLFEVIKEDYEKAFLRWCLQLALTAVLVILERHDLASY